MPETIRVNLPDGRVVHFPATMQPQEIEAAVSSLAGEKPQAPAAAQEQQPGFVDRVLEDNAALPVSIRAGQALLRGVKANPVAAAATGGALAAAPLTGGGSLLGAIAAAGLGGAGGAGAAIAARQLINQKPEPAANTLGTMASEGLANAAGEGIGQGAQLLGRGLYRAGVLPIQQVLGKYGDVVKTGIENRVLASPGGLSKIKGIKGERMAEKAAAIEQAGENASFSATGIADAAKQKLAPKVASLRDAGEAVNPDAFDTPLTRFAQQHPEGLSPAKLEGVKSTLDDRLGGAYQKLRKREPLTPKEESRMALSQTASRAQESVVPKYREMNKGIMDAGGLQRVLERRVNGSAGNQGLENALTMAIGPGAVPARLMMLPPVMSGLGIATHEAGANPLGRLIRQALLSALASGADQPE